MNLISGTGSYNLTILIDRHPTGTFTCDERELQAEIEKCRRFNCEYVRQHFQLGDQIHIEEDASLSRDKLPTRLLPHLFFIQYTVQGIDDPAACAKAEPLRRIQEIAYRVLYRKENSNKEDLAEFKEFVLKHQHRECPLPDKELDTMLIYYELSLDIALDQYVDETMTQRNAFMVEKHREAIEAGVNHIFTVVGPLHVEALKNAFPKAQVVDYADPTTYQKEGKNDKATALVAIGEE